MRYGKPLMLIGALAIVASTAVFELATFSRSSEAYRYIPVSLITGLVGLVVWFAGCAMISRATSARRLLIAGAAILVGLPACLALLDAISPALMNVHIGMGGFLAPVVASLFGALIFILVGLGRLVADWRRSTASR
jgi:hypothetical protein